VSDDAPDRFTAIARGLECPLDAPRPASNEHWDLIATLSASSLYLAKNQTYRGQSQLIFDRRHAARPDELTRDEWLAFSADLFAAQDAIMRTVGADHVNIESLGNVVPHLHWHIIPRYRDDPRWGAPVWLTTLDDMIDRRLEPADRQALIAAIRAALTATSGA
jgi:diadenosine tetraphosphate (Ap4A) HIT family hydrolase